MSNANKNEELRQEIARRAHLRYCDRGCVSGADVDDWLAAEREVLATRESDVPSPDRSRAKSRRTRKVGQ